MWGSVRHLPLHMRPQRFPRPLQPAVEEIGQHAQHRILGVFGLLGGFLQGESASTAEPYSWLTTRSE